MSGGLSGIACWSAILPLDVAKTIIETTPEKNHTRNPFRVLKLLVTIISCILELEMLNEMPDSVYYGRFTGDLVLEDAIWV
ncbi:hypothetical protein K7X08_016625 [Anisodus acutangulus]|uniref:Uncharacterized protein n=1 Tax=Anisodus acutangulus TaxID=402998 RepID=A0A9Q1LFK3_9SOLA|nr:hypothetical protein K7X08_016625 [Anisodus acutangulus]